MSSNHLRIGEGLVALVGRLIQEFMSLMRENDLSMPQIYTLMYLYHEGECQVSDIARLMGASSPAASQLVERLWQHGLVVREEDPENRRTKKVRLSEKGHALVTQGIVSNEFLAGLLSNLTAEQKSTVHTALGYLAEAMRSLRE